MGANAGKSLSQCKNRALVSFLFILACALGACARVAIPTTVAPGQPGDTPSPPHSGTLASSASTTRAASTTPATPNSRQSAIDVAASVGMQVSTPNPLLTFTPVSYDHNSNAILVEADIEGGASPALHDAHVPLYRLYGDGLVVFAGEKAPLATGLDAEVRVGRLNDVQIQNLLGYLSQVRFLSLNSYYEPKPKPEGLATGRITVYLSKAKTVRVYGLDSSAAPQAFVDAFKRISEAVPTESTASTPTEAYLSALAAGSVTDFKDATRLVPWPTGTGIRLADAANGLTMSGAGYATIAKLFGDASPGSLFREGERVYRVRFQPKLPRWTYLGDSLGMILNAPREFEGRAFDIVGYYRGANLFGEAGGSAPVSRSDWVIRDESGAMYVSGLAPRGLELNSRADAWTVVRLRAVVIYVRSGTSYLEARQVQVLSGESGRAVPPTPPNGPNRSMTPGAVRP